MRLIPPPVSGSAHLGDSNHSPLPNSTVTDQLRVSVHAADGKSYEINQAQLTSIAADAAQWITAASHSDWAEARRKFAADQFTARGFTFPQESTVTHTPVGGEIRWVPVRGISGDSSIDLSAWELWFSPEAAHRLAGLRGGPIPSRLLARASWNDIPQLERLLNLALDLDSMKVLAALSQQQH